MANYEFEILYGFSTLASVEADSRAEAEAKVKELTTETHVIHDGFSYPWDATEITLIDSDAEDW